MLYDGSSACGGTIDNHFVGALAELDERWHK